MAGFGLSKLGFKHFVNIMCHDNYVYQTTMPLAIGWHPHLLKAQQFLSSYVVMLQKQNYTCI